MPKGGGVYKLGGPYLAGGKWYYPVADTNYDKIGTASWYGDFFHGRKTANGEIYDMNALSAAHPTFPMPSYAKVTNLANNRSIIVRVNDRGPYASDRIIDLSHKAAELLGFHHHGTAQVRVQFWGPAPLNGDDTFERTVVAKQPWVTRVEHVKPPAVPTSGMFAATATLPPPRTQAAVTEVAKTSPGGGAPQVPSTWVTLPPSAGFDIKAGFAGR